MAVQRRRALRGAFQRSALWCGLHLLKTLGLSRSYSWHIAGAFPPLSAERESKSPLMLTPRITVLAQQDGRESSSHQLRRVMRTGTRFRVSRRCG